MTGETDAHCQDVTLEIMHVSSDSSKSQCPPCTLILVKVHFLHVFQLYAALCWRLLPKHTHTRTHTHTGYWAREGSDCSCTNDAIEILLLTPPAHSPSCLLPNTVAVCVKAAAVFFFFTEQI